MTTLPVCPQSVKPAEPAPVAAPILSGSQRYRLLGACDTAKSAASISESLVDDLPGHAALKLAHDKAHEAHAMLRAIYDASAPATVSK